MKKNKLIVALSVLIMAVMFVFATGTEVEAASKKQKTGKAYAKIIKEYQKAYRYAKTGKDYTKLDINYEFVASGGDGTPVYRIMDFNKDGNQELFVGLTSGEEWATIYDVYTFHDGKAVQLMQGIGYRSGTCCLRKKGIIESHSSGSAADTHYDFYKIPNKGNALKTVIALVINLRDKKPYSKIVNGKRTFISKKQHDKLYKKYSKKIKVTFYKVDSKAIKNVKKGKFNYKGQKSYRVTT